MDRHTIIARPTPAILDEMIGVLALRLGDPGQLRLRACAWHSLGHLRRIHGSLAAARRAARDRMAAAQAGAGAAA